MTDQATPSGATDWALIVDDHPLFCDALELTLRSVSKVSSIQTASRLSGALEVIEANEVRPSLIVLDLNLPDVSGLDGVVRLKAVVGACPVIVVSSMDENAIIGGAIGAGAAGFVPKHSRHSVFKEALNAIARGEVFKPAGYVETPEAMDMQSSVDRLASLTRQQSRILELICDGKLNKQIAYDLSIAETTVKAHVTAIMRKLGVQSRTQAVLVAQQTKFAAVLQSSD
ncbi:MAG: LuxR C-terminal-related transcriptional regulator [Sedimentitalea sp.]